VPKFPPLRFLIRKRRFVNLYINWIILLIWQVITKNRREHTAQMSFVTRNYVGYDVDALLGHCAIKIVRNMCRTSYENYLIINSVCLLTF